MNTPSLMELSADESAFDQPCKFGNRVERHAVYCHNTEWADAPRKCRCTWYTGGETRDEDCPGFVPQTAPDQAKSVPATTEKEKS